MNKYHDTLVLAAFDAALQEVILRERLEQEHQHEWQQLDADAEAGNLPEWTDE